jgi:Fur family ferric uptake transcriptional regulator
MTRQRRVILEELRKVDTHPSADEVYEMVRKRLPRISLGTIYRNLEILSETGEIQRLETGSHLKRFDGRADDHITSAACAAIGW